MGYQGGFLYGDFVPLKEAVMRVRKLAKVGPQLAKAVAPRLRMEVTKEFRQGVDPYGKAWKPLAPRTLEKHGPPPLTDSGSMKGGLISKALGYAIRMDLPHPAFLHQYGWRRRMAQPRPVKGYLGGERRTVAMQTHGTGGPARPMFPSKGRLPATWKAAIKATLAALIAKG